MLMAAQASQLTLGWQRRQKYRLLLHPIGEAGFSFRRSIINPPSGIQVSRSSLPVCMKVQEIVTDNYN